MEKIEFTLSKNEKQILDTMWKENRSLNRTEIIELTKNKSWKASSIHILLNQLLDKNAIVVDGYEKMVKNYGRTYAPTITSDEYDLMQMKLNLKEIKPKKSSVFNFVSFLVNSKTFNKDDVQELQDLLDEAKEK